VQKAALVETHNSQKLHKQPITSQSRSPVKKPCVLYRVVNKEVEQQFSRRAQHCNKKNLLSTSVKVKS
jgi:hypothetical protein